MPGGHMLLPYHYGGIISLNTCLLSHKLVIVILIWGPFGAILPSSTKMIQKNMYLDRTYTNCGYKCVMITRARERSHNFIIGIYM